EPGNICCLPRWSQAETQAGGYAHRGLPHVGGKNADQMSLRAQLLGQVAYEPALAQPGMAEHQGRARVKLSAERFPAGGRYDGEIRCRVHPVPNLARFSTW